jgi:hypothetical protein
VVQLIVAIIGISYNHPKIDDIIADINPKITTDDTIVCEDDLSGVGLAVRMTGFNVADKKVCIGDMLDRERIYENRREHIIDISDRLFIIDDGKCELNKYTIKILKQKLKLFEVIPVGV